MNSPIRAQEPWRYDNRRERWLNSQREPILAVRLPRPQEGGAARNTGRSFGAVRAIVDPWTCSLLTSFRG
jgi:hypothetical protein